MISPSQRPLPTQKNTTDIHDFVEIWIHNHSKGAAADLRLRPHDHQDGPPSMTTVPNYRTVLREVTSCGLLPKLRRNMRKKKWKEQKFNTNYYHTLRHDFGTQSFILDAGLLARSQYPEGPATGHLDTGFSWFPCVYKRMLRWFPSFQVATTCLSCSPPDLNFLVTFFIFVYM